MKGSTLSRRLNLLLVQWSLLFLLLLSLLGAFALSRFRTALLEERLLLARSVARHLDASLADSLKSLGRLAAALDSLDQSAAPALRAHRFQSPFREAIYILDAQGRVLVSDPEGSLPPARDALPDHEAITRLLRDPRAREPRLAAVHPFRRRDRSYFLVEEMAPPGSSLSAFLKDLGTGSGLHVAVVDSNGNVIASPDRGQMFRELPSATTLRERIDAKRVLVSPSAPCPLCNATRGPAAEALMVPLRQAPWGVLVLEHSGFPFGGPRQMLGGVLVAAALLLVMGTFLARALSRSLLAPIQSLYRQAERLRQGDLESRIDVRGDHEMQVLGATLDEARKRLRGSLGELQSLNEDLERQVALRTRGLEAQFRNLTLLHEVSLVCARERAPARYLPEVLRLVAEHHGFRGAGLVTPGGPDAPIAIVWPPTERLEWLAPGAPPPSGWRRRDIRFHEHTWGSLYHPVEPESDERVMESLLLELGLALHGTELVRQLVHQDGQRRALVARLLTAGEDERRRIARELHDEIAQLLTAIQLSLESASGGTELDKARQLLEQTQTEIHRIIYDLRPSLLDDLGLAAAVKWYAQRNLAERGVELSLEVDEELRLPPEIEVTTFRIFQEIVTNILRHAHAESVSVELYRSGSSLRLSVEDDGLGFDPAKSEGAGLLGMGERASLVGGTISIDSEPHMGTSVQLQIPLPP